ncbi:FAD-binding and (Fe-S)-binding domain-containing protein [Thiomicrospira pelophila]|uniref:FAD-binding and (Fe-S)-binding domain-containing protein n=1 Tax=Thiomicrospira pelophila TaxID=934 RepID=UPI0006896417|nr:FAD-binding and (Fe-S)-binding domain-containing protein [Thiomicrospira pelophila]
MLYTTDASVFEITPIRVLTPKDRNGLVHCIRDLVEQDYPITLRAGGTSLGGQAIGSGVIVDVSKYLNQIIEYRPQQKQIKVEPGVIQDDLNDYLKADGLMFAPDTSTSNRAMIGGMVGNNSAGAYSVYYGTTREHVVSLDAVLADGAEVVFEDLSADQLVQKMQQTDLEGEIYRETMQLLETHQAEILVQSPDSSIIRRNTGYALDVMLREHQPFNSKGKPFSLVPLICGSEGTLCTVTAATLNLVERPKFRQLICAHFDSIDAALNQVEGLLKFKPAAIELIDKATLDATQTNSEQQANRFWIQGDPKAVLVVELFYQTKATLTKRLAEYQAWLLEQGAYAAPIIDPADASRVWSLRKSGLGLLMGKRSRKKAVAVIEDAAVPVSNLPAFYQAAQALMTEFNLNAVYYGHASVGLIHIRPELDLAKPSDREVFAKLAARFSSLVKRFRGALSAEHGDGRIRAPYLKEQVGEEVYATWQTLKQTFDPKGLFNPGVILGETPITQNQRADRQPSHKLETGFDWRADISLMDAVEKCNGAGTCRKSNGLMCPSYQATREEAYSTRGRSNLLRRALTEPNPKVALSGNELQDALSHCLSCKACKTECPASVDLSRLKAEVTYQLGIKKSVAWALKRQHKLMSWGVRHPKWFKWWQNFGLSKRALGVDRRRRLPGAGAFSLEAWWNSLSSQQLDPMAEGDVRQKVWVLCDLFSQFQEPEVGKATLSSLIKLGFDVKPVFMKASPRTLISQGLLPQASEELARLIQMLNQVELDDYIIGVEPSEVITWRDEAKDLLPKTADAFDYRQVRLYEELIVDLVAQKRLPKLASVNRKLWLHVHCHQKALAKPEHVEQALAQVPGLVVKTIQSGCCGMAGDFGYRQYDLSVKIAEQALLPALAEAQAEDWVVATGISCRTQVADLTERKAQHVAQIFDHVLPELEMRDV